MIDGGTIAVILLSALLAAVMYLYLSDKSYAFWTGGPIRHAILRVMARLMRQIDDIS